MLELIVTGTGRCGTGFVARWLTSIGIPATHEGVFTPYGMGQALFALRSGGKAMADVAWEAAPFLRMADVAYVPVIHLVRHPKRVIASLVRVPPSTTPAYDEFCKVHFPELYDYEYPLDQAAARVLAITGRIECLRPERYVWRIEDGTDGVLAWLKECGLYSKPHDPGEPFEDEQYNHKAGEEVNVQLEDMASELAEAILALCERYGYEWDVSKSR